MNKKTQILKLVVLLIIFSFSGHSQDKDLSNYRWTTIDATGEVKGRHENAFVEFQDKFYLLGGRGINPVNVFDPQTNQWKSNGKSPMEIHHFQPVIFGDAIYIIGAMTGKYPKEKPLENIWIYYPLKDKWEKGSVIPEERRRGGAGVVLYNNRFYMACGIEYGHTSGTNNYFDCYDPKTDTWETLTKAPHIRDHFAAIVVNDKMYCIGGRNTSVHTVDRFGAFFDATIPYNDVYDFKTKTWTTLKHELPLPTAAAGVVNIENYILYMGGEGSQKQAYNQTQCLDINSGEWIQLAALNIGRHGSGAILYHNEIYLAAGSQNQGGGNMNSIEKFSVAHNWKSLFDGETLTGWEVKCVEKDKNNNFWTVDNGTILCNSMESESHNYIWLQSIEEFDDFELRFKFQASREHKGNSGMQVRSRYFENDEVEKGNVGWLDGPQVDIDPNNPWRNGFIYDETRDIKRWINPSLPNWSISKEEYAPKKVVHYFNDEETGWNDVTIICKGNQIKTLEGIGEKAWYQQAAEISNYDMFDNYNRQIDDDNPDVSD
jgi:N-acetylneuraminic acid mutarotase